MLTHDHLLMGLNALSRAHSMDYFADGHRGAAMIAAYYLCRREDMEPGGAGAIARIIDEIWVGTPLFAPIPDEDPDPGLATDIVDALSAKTDRLREAGHNVIFPSLALKAMAELPETITPSRVAGIYRLVDCFTEATDLPEGGDVTVPDAADRAQFSEFVLSEALDTMERFDGRGQGWTGHLLTHARAVADLRDAGRVEGAGNAREGLALYIKRTRMGPGEGDRVIPEHQRRDCTPLEQRYWENRAPASVGLGHCLKYPYAFYCLLDELTDADLKGRCIAEAYHVL